MRVLLPQQRWIPLEGAKVSIDPPPSKMKLFSMNAIVNLKSNCTRLANYTKTIKTSVFTSTWQKLETGCLTAFAPLGVLAP